MCKYLFKSSSADFHFWTNRHQIIRVLEGLIWRATYNLTDLRVLYNTHFIQNPLPPPISWLTVVFTIRKYYSLLSKWLNVRSANRIFPLCESLPNCYLCWIYVRTVTLRRFASIVPRSEIYVSTVVLRIPCAPNDTKSGPLVGFGRVRGPGVGPSQLL